MMPNEDSFDFSEYYVSDSQEPFPPDESKDESQKPFDFSQYQPKEPPTKLEEFTRHAVRTGSRIAETVAGFPGDVVNFAKFISESLPTPPKSLRGKPSVVQEYGKKGLELIPSSNDIKEMSSYLTSGFTDPKGAVEELGDDITSLATSLLIPSKDPTKFKSLLKSLGAAAATKGVGKGVESLGGGEKMQAGAEIGTLFLTGLLGKKTADKFVGEQYQKAKSQIPKGTMLDTTKLASSLEGIEKDLSRGISTSTKNEVKGAISELRAKASGGAMPAEEIIESYHNINERLTSKKLFDELSTGERKILKHRYDTFKDSINEEISKYGKKNPEFYKDWRNANQAFATIAQSKKVSNFLQDKLGKMPKYLTGSLAAELLFGHPYAAGAMGTSAMSVKTGELLYRISKSPKLRQHYLNVISEASKENLPGVIKNLKFLNKEAEKID